MNAESNELKYAVPGGLIGVGTRIDPTLTRADRLVGQVLGAVGKLPEVFTELEISFFLLRRLLGVRVEGNIKHAKVPPFLVLSFFFAVRVMTNLFKLPSFGAEACDERRVYLTFFFGSCFGSCRFGLAEWLIVWGVLCRLPNYKTMKC